jgi:hypothetical protein
MSKEDLNTLFCRRKDAQRVNVTGWGYQVDEHAVI